MVEYQAIKIKSPAQIEKLKRVKDLSDTKRANIAKFWEKPPGKEKLVISSSEGVEVVYSTSEAFAQLENQPEVEVPLSFL